MTTQPLPPQPSNLKQQLVKAFRAAGVIGLIFGTFHALAAIADNAGMIRFYDAILNFGLGVVALICAELLVKGRVSVLYLSGVTIAVLLVYSLVMGRGFNFVIAIIGGILVGLLIALRQRAEIK